MDLKDLADAAVLPVRSVGAGIFEREAVLDDPFVGDVESRDELLYADDEDDVGGASSVGASCSPTRRR